jgi:integrase
MSLAFALMAAINGSTGGLVEELDPRLGLLHRGAVGELDRVRRAPTLPQAKVEDRVHRVDVEQLLAARYPDDAFGRIEPTPYLTAAMTGLRQGELLGLRWRDVDFDAHKLRVVSPFVRGEFGDPKSSGSGRSVPMAERVADALSELRAAPTTGATTILSSATPRPASRLTARSSSAASTRPSARPTDHRRDECRPAPTFHRSELQERQRRTEATP